MDKLEIKNISKSYKKRMILRDISLELNKGEVVGLFGPNGAGKTTCFSIIIGLMKPDKGKLLLNNKNITNLPIYLRARLGLGYLLQEPSIFRGLSVKDNIKAILEISENDKEIIEQKTNDLLKKFSILHLKDLPAVGLSGGERRRLEIARTLAIEPKFIMLDEPLAGIDPLAVSDIKNLITYLREFNIGILITDHNVRDTLDIVDRAYVIFDGKVLLEGNSKEVATSEEVKKVYLGNTFS
ncbi:LPS export ABC transporter ATP-binding protein [Rickettsia endosymbiont of Polydrusus tereticollis]|jgi:lipopolysaccharide export system ATP-binding protein|uniref:LPS export ABC transporter ATP-binding protein n=1 Tax=Rickettsia endosymbiont of Polydrusus tereticollis TaxID=3066251 RepID=UPI003132AAE1|nr:LPS export ABC transporter ATP-binding protein [Rickettsia endosymbiont of Oxypoda opaca]